MENDFEHHVFYQNDIDKLKAVYRTARKKILGTEKRMHEKKLKSLNVFILVQQPSNR